MRHSTLGIRCFGLAIVAALGLMAFMAGAAQAEDLTDGGKPGKFLVLGSGALVVGATATGVQVGAGKLLVPGRNLTIECKEGEVLEGKFLNETEALKKVLFKKCVALVLSKETEEVAGCTITNGKHITASAIILPRLHGGELFFLLHPDVGTTFTTIEFESGKGCALPLKNNITGLIAALDHNETAVNHLVLFSQVIQKLLGAKILFGTFETFVDAHYTFSLTGPHLGCTWSVV